MRDAHAMRHGCVRQQFLSDPSQQQTRLFKPREGECYTGKMNPMPASTKKLLTILAILIAIICLQVALMN